METNRRTSDHNTLDDQPVRYYSIETGEEFSLEFMRDRVNRKRVNFKIPVVSKVSKDPVTESDDNLHDGHPNVAIYGKTGDHDGFIQLTDTESERLLLDARKGIFKSQEHKVGTSKTVPWDPYTFEHSLGTGTGTVQVIKNEDIEQVKKIGSGTFGTVYHAKWRGADVAIKRIKDSSRLSKQQKKAKELSEVDILSTLQHPNVLAFYGVVQDGPGKVVATVTEFMEDGSLYSVLCRNDGYFNDDKRRLMVAMQTAFGMEYLHSKNIVHYDLKSENLLVNVGNPLRPICKIGDFGSAKAKQQTLFSGGDIRGTVPWMAPELVANKKLSDKIDVFSFGVVLWEILSGGAEPYPNMHEFAILAEVSTRRLRPTIPNNWDVAWTTLMKDCWEEDPQDRPTFTEIATRLRRMFTTATTTRRN